MVVIHGESNSGKSVKALSLINRKKKTLYFALDFDKRIKNIELKNKNIQVAAFPTSGYLPEIEAEILNNGGLIGNKLSYVVIDPINFIKSENKDLLKLILTLKSLEEEYKKFELIIVVNTLFHFEFPAKFKELNGIQFIEVKKKKKKVIAL